MACLTIDGTPQGTEIKHATVKYGGERLTFQLSDAATSLRAPFGLDDGFKFCGKPSLNIEMPDAQLAFFRDGIEAAVKEAAVKNKEAWFGAVKPLPADEAVRASFNSRVREDEAGKYIPTLKVNVGLGVDASKAVRVLTARRLPSGKVTKPTPGAPADVTRGSRVVPVLRTAGGVWVSVNAKKKTFEYGLVFEASDLLVTWSRREPLRPPSTSRWRPRTRRRTAVMARLSTVGSSTTEARARPGRRGALHGRGGRRAQPGWRGGGVGRARGARARGEGARGAGKRGRLAPVWWWR